jgi:uncharacterized membrane protein
MKRGARLMTVLSLIIVSSLSTFLLFLRFLYSGRLGFPFLFWNLFLAWLPFLLSLLFTFMSTHRRSHRIPSLICGFLWLILLPNAPYLITDLIHLGRVGGAPIWFDLLLLLSFGLSGLLLGLASVQTMQLEISCRYGRLSGWLFAAITLSLAAFGIYIGRFLRWNSWDIILNPHHIAADLLTLTASPLLQLRLLIVTAVLATIFLVTYLILFGPHANEIITIEDAWIGSKSQYNTKKPTLY